MKEQSAVILWDGDVHWKDIEAKIALLKEHHISCLCIAMANIPVAAVNVEGVLAIREIDPIGSLKALIRGINYVKTEFWPRPNIDASGVFVIYSNAKISKRLISKMQQISTAMPVKNIDMLVGLQLSESKKTKYVLDAWSNIKHSADANKGHQFAGALFLRTTAFSRFFSSPSSKIEGAIQEMLRSECKLYGVVYECCDAA